MLKHIVDAYGGRACPATSRWVYANTGLERPETLDFIDTCATAWGVPIVWVEYDWDAPHRTRLVDYRTASRDGEPYAALIERKGFVPNATLRYCTGFLKRDRIESYARYRLGLKRWHSVVGLRADEPRRVWRMRAMDCGSRTGGRAALPPADARVAERDVLAWWKDQPFDLGLPGLCRQLRLLLPQGTQQAPAHHPRGPVARRLVDRAGGAGREPHRPRRPGLREHEAVPDRRDLRRAQGRRARPAGPLRRDRRGRGRRRVRLHLHRLTARAPPTR